MTGTHYSQPTIFTGNIASPNIGKYSMQNGGESLDVKFPMMRLCQEKDATSTCCGIILSRTQ